MKFSLANWIIAVPLLFLSLFLSQTVVAVSVVNGSMNHDTGTNYIYFNGYIAPGWLQDNSGTNTSVYTTSPDIFVHTMTAFDMAWVESSDGGKFAHAVGWLDGENQEGIYQTISGLTIGEQYIVQFEQSITDTNFLASGISGQWQVRFGSTTQYSAAMLSPAAMTAYGWDLQALVFTATASTQDLSFLAKSTLEADPVYLGLDGVSIRPVNLAAVPIPGAIVLFAPGVVLLLARSHFGFRR